MGKLKIGGLVAVCLVVGLALHYSLPRVTVTEVIGVEVKRTDTETGNRDVYMIQTRRPESGEILVFRNEDNWLYLKPDSANLQATAASFARDGELGHVAIRHYGWRFSLLSVFPNAISAWQVDPGYRHIPIFNVLAIVFLLGGGLFARHRIMMAWRRMFGKRPDASHNRDTENGPSSPDKPNEAGASSGIDSWFEESHETPNSNGSGQKGPKDAP